ncbi:hypothetical protein FA13DRAFT_1707537 [Coprinellus micaceus]|uniref:CxC2-like cysteine cluster KDZ transposase-associated domain-containing protein n=1 Tax=Coprinellus micaceus TaxID=71717 RepID=A0A4Y7TKG7_COPMI|nr:hypothetical protein FA13DRAFT_1707537 [Coprinellus micaceus]
MPSWRRRVSARQSARYHRANPFHRIEAWTGSMWIPLWLWRLGTIICLGHHGAPCPRYDTSLDELEERMLRLTGSGQMDYATLSEDPTFGFAMPLLGDDLAMTVAHTNRMHQVPVFSCQCDNAPTKDIQLLRSGLYPSTSKNTKTVFSIQLLKHFQLMLVDGHVSVEKYMAILCRLTNYVFPGTVPDRGREITRTWQQYSYVTTLKRHGFGMSSAMLRPPSNGNFGLNHKFRADLELVVLLFDGCGFFVESKKVARHLLVAKDTPDVRHGSFPPLQIFILKSISLTGEDMCLTPGSEREEQAGTVDLQKGERQINMDLALSEACDATKAGQTLGLRFAYDINCQYCVNFHQRVGPGKPLSIPENMALLFVIGLFHVHGHKEECLARYAPTFVPGAGVCSGEIGESLWSTLNPIANMIRGMTLGHRIDTMEACMRDNNWKKVLGMVYWLISQHKRAKIGSKDASDDFDKLDKTPPDHLRQQWQADMEKANKGRFHDPKAMDVYMSAIDKGEALQDVHVRLMREEREIGKKRGIAKWLSTGFKLQEDQLKLESQILHSNMQLSSKVIVIERKHDSLLRRIKLWDTMGDELWEQLDLSSSSGDRVPSLDTCICEDQTTCACDLSEELRTLARVNMAQVKPKKSSLSTDASTMENPEDMLILLPSAVHTLPPYWVEVLDTEEVLRVAQAHDALEEVRVHVAHKSYLYRRDKGLATGHRGRATQYNQINDVERSLQQAVRRYGLATWVLKKMGRFEQHAELKDIQNKDVRAVTSVWDPNARGERDTELSWIFKAVRPNVASGSSNAPGQEDQGKKDKTGEEYIDDLIRINWICARSRKDRWEEELKMVESEMEWYVRYTLHRTLCAKQWAQDALSPGHKAYAMHQADMWRRLGSHAKSLFAKTPGVKVDVDIPVPDPVVKLDSDA